MRLLAPFVILAGLLAVSVVMDKPAPRADLTFGSISIETLDPQLMHAADDIRVGYALFEGLCTFDPFDFTVKPGVAERWDVSDDGLTYTFHLRKDAKWSDGHPLTADDFRFSWRVGLMPDTGSKYVDFLFNLKGGEDYFKWCTAELEKVAAIEDVDARFAAAQRRVSESVAKFDELVGVEAVDPHTLRVTAARRMPYFLEILAAWATWPIPRHVLEREVEIDGRMRRLMEVDPSSMMLRRKPQWIHPGNEPNTMVCNGPYRLADWRFKRSMRLVANEHYWNPAAVKSKTIEMVSFNSIDTMYVAYERGDIDVLYGATALNYAPELIEAAAAGRRDDVHNFPAYGTYYLAINCRPELPGGKKNPFTDPRVRQALNLAVDREYIVNEVTRLRQTPATTFVPPRSIPGYPEVEGYGYDPERAKKLLAEAGYPGGKGLPALPIIYNVPGPHANVAQAVGRMWENTLGIKVSYDSQEWSVFLKRRGDGEFVVARSGWFGDYADPTTFLNLFRSTDGHNDPGFKDARYDAMLDAAANELDQAKRFAILAEAERYVMTERFPIVPLYYYSVVHLYDPERVTGVTLQARDLQMYQYVEVKRE